MICNGLRKGMQQSTKTSALSVCATESVRIDCNCKGNRYSVLTDAAFAVSFFAYFYSAFYYYRFYFNRFVGYICEFYMPCKKQECCV